MDIVLSATSIVKKSILESLELTGGSLDIERVLITLGLAFLIGLFIFFIYRITFSGVVFNRRFASSLIMLSMVTAMIMLPITTNLMLSLGMVGALSIVRFRTAVKDPMDTIFMFWSIAAGITLGAGMQMILPAVVGSVVIGLLVFIVSFMKIKTSMTYVLIVRFRPESIGNVDSLIKHIHKSKLKSKTATAKYIEITMEVSLKDSEVYITEKFMQIEGVLDASIISYDGDIIA